VPRYAGSTLRFDRQGRQIDSLKPAEIFQPGKQPIKVKARILFLLGGQAIGVNNGGSGSKAQYLAASGQYEYSAWRANSINRYSLMDE